MMFSSSTQWKKSEKGFTLVELMVSVALFSMVVTASMGTLITMIDANNKAQALYSVMTNLSFAIDSMTRNIRTGYYYYCPNSDSYVNQLLNTNVETKDCGGKKEVLIFTREVDGKRTAYKYNDTDKSIEQYVGGNNWQRITSDDITIEKLELDTKGAASGGDQPTVSILIQGVVTGQRGTGADFSIQTLVVQQVIDY